MGVKAYRRDGLLVKPHASANNYDTLEICSHEVAQALCDFRSYSRGNTIELEAIGGLRGSKFALNCFDDLAIGNITQGQKEVRM